MDNEKINAGIYFSSQYKEEHKYFATKNVCLGKKQCFLVKICNMQMRLVKALTLKLILTLILNSTKIIEGQTKACFLQWLKTNLCQLTDAIDQSDWPTLCSQSKFSLLKEKHGFFPWWILLNLDTLTAGPCWSYWLQYIWAKFMIYTKIEKLWILFEAGEKILMN